MRHDDYLAARHFPALDGLRAISVLMVLAFHTHDALWEPLRGYLGVTIFFVISGMLITTLLLREEQRTGRVDIGAFLARRWWRIGPLYLVALACFSAGVFTGVAGGGGDYGQRLLYFGTFLNEFAGPGTFAHSWSLGIEEKFYFAWPLLAFAIAPLARRRALLATLLLTAAIASLALSPRAYPAVFAPILAGCAVAIALHHPAGFRRLAPLSRGLPLAFLLALAAVALRAFAPHGYVPLTNVPFALVVALLMPAVVLRGNALQRALATPVLRYIGRRSYAVYLFHLLVADVLAHLLAPGGSVATALLRLALLTAATLVLAEFLHRTVEAPLIALGRRRHAASAGRPWRARLRAARA